MNRVIRNRCNVELEKNHPGSHPHLAETGEVKKARRAGKKKKKKK
jgi:hypothetical protein